MGLLREAIVGRLVRSGGGVLRRGVLGRANGTPVGGYSAVKPCSAANAFELPAAPAAPKAAVAVKVIP